jgi:hypothetical protein
MQPRISRLCRLKWRACLYRPALRWNRWISSLSAVPASQLGRSQAVRQRILIPPFGGSIPPAPAKQCGLRPTCSGIARKARRWAAFALLPRVSTFPFGALGRPNCRKSPPAIASIPVFGRLGPETGFDPHCRLRATVPVAPAIGSARTGRVDQRARCISADLVPIVGRPLSVSPPVRPLKRVP